MIRLIYSPSIYLFPFEQVTQRIWSIFKDESVFMNRCCGPMCTKGRVCALGSLAAYSSGQIFHNRSKGEAWMPIIGQSVRIWCVKGDGSLMIQPIRNWQGLNLVHIRQTALGYLGLYKTESIGYRGSHSKILILSLNTHFEPTLGLLEKFASQTQSLCN